MTMQEKPVDVARVPCEICLKEVPRSEAVVAEAVDYVAYFCGLECYARWQAQQGQQGQSEPPAGPAGG